MKLVDLVNKKILIAGYGKEGKSTHEYLKQYVPSAHVDITDLKDGPSYLDKQDQYDLVIKSPGIQKKYIRVPYTTATNIFFANTKGMTIGITGTKGKSTTSSLIYAILKEAGLRAHLVGNIGNPMLHDLPYEGSNDVYVCELSSYQLDDIRYSPHIAVIINVFPEHMNYHGSVEDYWRAKKRIVEYSGPEDFLVYNPRSNKLQTLASETKAKAVPYVDTLPFPDSDIPLLGEHNKENVRAAATVASLLAVPSECVHRAVQSFTPLPHRLECVGTYKGITFYDDAISTTPESTICAILSIPDISVMMLGGLDRGYDFKELIEVIRKSKIRNLVLFPDSGKRMEELLRENPGDSYTILRSSSMEEAVRFAYDHAPKGTVCLLSTASPSYSVWKNFEEKGDLFQRYVKELAI
jgi:UDP-N-acetylmuramoyl-L-alanine---L-glutamate ligase